MLQRDRLEQALSALGHKRKIPSAGRESTRVAGTISPKHRVSPDGESDAPLPAHCGGDGVLLEAILRGGWVETERGPVFLKDTWFAPDHHRGGRPLGAILEASPEVLGILVRGRAPGTGGQESKVPNSSRLCFLDLETTGLAGGTGTYAFLACLGSFEGDAFRLRQYFLADLAGEAAMLALVGRDLARFEGLVSFNGRAFDVPLIQTRWTLARMPDPCAGLPHIDLLHVVRRLYRHRLESCRLAEAEAHILGFERSGDVPGHLIPSLYFDYIRSGRVGPLRGVFRHNEDDVLSIVGVLAAVLDLFSRPKPAPRDAVSLGRWWELENRPERAEAFYRMALTHVEERWEADEDWRTAASRYALIRKRAGARREVLSLWHQLWKQGDHLAGVEIAKYLEHEAKDIRGAEQVTRTLLKQANLGEVAEIERRLRRLQRKLQSLSEKDL